MYSSGEVECVFRDGWVLISDESLQNFSAIKGSGEIVSEVDCNNISKEKLAVFYSLILPVSHTPNIPYLIDKDDAFGSSVSSQSILKSRDWRKCHSEMTSDSINLVCQLGLSDCATFKLRLSDLVFEARIPVRIPDSPRVLSCQQTVGIFYEYRFVSLRGSIFNPPRPFLIEPLQMSLDIALSDYLDPSDVTHLYGLISLARDNLIYFLHETRPTADEYCFPKFFRFPHTPDRNMSDDLSSRISPAIVSPSLPHELVHTEVYLENDQICTLFVPSISAGVAHIVSPTFVAFSTDQDCQVWKVFRREATMMEIVSLSCPPTDSESVQLVSSLQRMRALVQHNNRVLKRMPVLNKSGIVPVTGISEIFPRHEEQPGIGSFQITSSGHVSCVFCDRVRLSFQLVIPGGTIDRQYGSVKFLTPSGEEEELTWEFLLGNRHEGWQTYAFYVWSALRFVYDSVKPGALHQVDSWDNSLQFDSIDIEQLLDRTNQFIKVIKS